MNCIKEYTVECNPINIDKGLIEVLKNIKCTRVSLGIQSFNIDTLNICNRNNQTFEVVISALDQLDILNVIISIDLISGLPLLNIKNELYYLNKILKKYKNIQHISIYDLTIEKGSVFYEKINNINLPEEQLVFNYEKNLLRILNKYNFKKYEVSNYCKNNNKCMHNMTYWKYDNYLGLGPSAHSTVDDLRVENEPDIIKYINNDYKKNFKLSMKDRLKEYILMGLRLTEGINIIDFNKRFNIDFYLNFNFIIKKYKKFIKQAGNYLSLNKKGLNILNKILIDFFEIIDMLE